MNGIASRQAGRIAAVPHMVASLHVRGDENNKQAVVCKNPSGLRLLHSNGRSKQRRKPSPREISCALCKGQGTAQRFRESREYHGGVFLPQLQRAFATYGLSFLSFFLDSSVSVDIRFQTDNDAGKLSARKGPPRRCHSYPGNVSRHLTWGQNSSGRQASLIWASHTATQTIGVQCAKTKIIAICSFSSPPRTPL